SSLRLSLPFGSTQAPSLRRCTSATSGRGPSRTTIPPAPMIGARAMLLLIPGDSSISLPHLWRVAGSGLHFARSGLRLLAGKLVGKRPAKEQDHDFVISSNRRALAPRAGRRRRDS